MQLKDEGMKTIRELYAIGGEFQCAVKISSGEIAKLDYFVVCGILEVYHAARPEQQRKMNCYKVSELMELFFTTVVFVPEVLVKTTMRAASGLLEEDLDLTSFKGKYVH